MTTSSSRQDPPAITVRVWLIAVVTGAAAFVAMLDSTVANLALVAIRDEFNSRFAEVQWVITAYLIALATSLPCAAWLGNRIGLGRIWSISLAAFVVASLACALAPGIRELIAARVVQGLVAGLMIPSGQAVVGLVAGPAQLGRLFGVIGLAIALGPALGPAIGGIMIDRVSWRWLFAFSIPIALLALIAARGLVPGGKQDEDREFKPLEFLLLSGGLGLLLYSAIELGMGGYGWRESAALFAGTTSLAAFAKRNAAAAEPLIRFRLLRSPSFAAAVVTTGLAGANLYGGLLLIPLYLQSFVGFSASITGLMLLAMGLGTALAMPFSGMLADRFGGGRVTFAGGIVLVATTFPFLIPGTLSVELVVLVLALRGAALAWLQVPSMTSAYELTDNRDMGDATVLVNIAQRVGGAIGAAILAIAVVRYGDGGEREGYLLAFTLLTGIAMAGAIAATSLSTNERAGSSARSIRRAAPGAFNRRAMAKKRRTANK